MKRRLERRGIGVKLSLYALFAGMLMAGCGSTASAQSVAPARPPAVAASCAGVSPAREFAMARIVFVGRMLPGPSTSMDRRAVLGSPATVRVLRYLKGRGPRTVKVKTAATIRNRGITVAEDGIEPQVGEIWKIYSGSRRQPFDTSICGGSARIMSAVRVALDLWSGFPVHPSADRSVCSVRASCLIQAPAFATTPRGPRSTKAGPPRAPMVARSPSPDERRPRWVASQPVSVSGPEPRRLA